MTRGFRPLGAMDSSRAFDRAEMNYETGTLVLATCFLRRDFETTTSVHTLASSGIHSRFGFSILDPGLAHQNIS